MRIADLRTPQVLIDRPRLFGNLDRVQHLASTAGVRLRPHAKTHKSPVIARWQIERGAAGICCAKIGEAEIFARAGIGDIRLPYPVQPSNADRLLALMDQAAVSIIVDDLEVARGWSERMVSARRRLDVLVKVDVGFHRCGIDPEDAGAVGFIRTAAGLPGLHVLGLLSHAGHGYAAESEDALRAIARREIEILSTLRERAARDGVALEEISVGATPSLRFTAGATGPTEWRPGNYVYFDRSQVGLGAATLDECAMTVLATVVSKPAADRIVLDCGSKVLAADQARGFDRPTGYGAVLAPSGRVEAGLSIERLSEEHAVVRVSGTTALRPGDRVRVLPNHACVVANLVDQVHLVDEDRIVETLAVAARGKVT